MNTLGERLKHLRKSSSTSQELLAKETGISRSNISKIESNDINPTSNAIIAIAKFFTVSIDWLLTGETKKPDSASEGNGENEFIVMETSESYMTPSASKKKGHMLIDQLSDDAVKRTIEFMEFELFKQTGKNRQK